MSKNHLQQIRTHWVNDRWDTITDETGVVTGYKSVSMIHADGFALGNAISVITGVDPTSADETNTTLRLVITIDQAERLNKRRAEDILETTNYTVTEYGSFGNGDEGIIIHKFDEREGNSLKWALDTLEIINFYQTRDRIGIRGQDARVYERVMEEITHRRPLPVLGQVSSNLQTKFAEPAQGPEPTGG